MSALVAHKSKNKHETHVCNSCLHPYRHKQTLDEHVPYCLRNAPRKYFDTIHVKLATDAGLVVPFLPGISVLVLEFRRTVHSYFLV